MPGGAAEAGGTAIGVTVASWSERLRANRWLTREVAAAHLFERLERLIASDAYVAMAGGPGTLGEVAITWNLFQTDATARKPLVLVGTPWRRVIACLQDGIRTTAQDLALLRLVDTVDDVVPALRAAAP